jgi:futalosine hydrolase
LSISNYYIVAATIAEVQPLIDFCQVKYTKVAPLVYQLSEHNHLHISIHGVGIANSLYHLTTISIQQPTVIIQAGIAGTFNHQLAIGNVYCVGADRFADIGAEHNDKFVDAFTMGLIDANRHPYTNGWLFNTEKPYPTFFSGLMTVNAITVNTVSGAEKTIAQWQQLYKPTLETMEGAALHYVCLQQQIAFIQLRAISNVVEQRDISKWNIPLAITNLNTILIEYITTLTVNT